MHNVYAIIVHFHKFVLICSNFMSHFQAIIYELNVYNVITNAVKFDSFQNCRIDRKISC